MRILVIEDDTPLASVLERGLSLAGFEVVIAADGLAGGLRRRLVGRLRGRRLRPTLAVIDRLRHDPSLADTIGADRVGAVFRDRAGLMWVGTWGEGVARHDPRTRAFRSLRVNASMLWRLRRSKVSIHS